MFSHSPRHLGAFLVLLATTGFAGKTILTKLVYRYGVDPLTLLTLRMLMAGVFFTFILILNVARGRWNLRLDLKSWFLIILLGVGGYYLSSYLDFLGLYYIDANLGRMILFLYPTMVVVIDSLLTKIPISSSTKISLLFCYFGLFLMMSPNLGTPKGDFLLGAGYIFFSALIYAFYLVGVDRLFKNLAINFFVSLNFLAASLFILSHFALTRPLGALNLPSEAYWLIFLMASFSTVIPIYALSTGLALIGAPKAATLSMVGPAVTLVLGVYVLDESVILIQVLGAVLMIIGVARIK
ncbi:MAG: DMT family transporter [Deltaproteobacteria bacterium]|jgi:drug/metabolite transporter (DMT)-like permease|nr:DMT family transporter [Deltaproteobacteria bacterium]